MDPLVSILINNHNYERFVGDAIESALAQTYEECEVIVIDDGSTDASWKVISRFGKRIRGIASKNRGQAAAIGLAFSESKGELICLLDSDDAFFPEKVARVVEAMRGTEAQWCFHHLQWTDAELTAVNMPPNPFKTGLYDVRDDVRSGTVKFTPPATSGLSFSRVLFEGMLPIPRGASDNYLKFLSLAIAPGVYLQDQLGYQRVHETNWYTNRKDPTIKADLQLITAAGLKAKLPAYGTTWNNMYADGMATKLALSSNLSHLYKGSQDFLHTLSFSERVALWTRVAYKTTKLSLRRMGSTS